MVGDYGLRHAVSCCAMLCYGMVCYAVQCNVMLCYARVCSVVLCDAVACNDATLCHGVSVPCHCMLCHLMRC